LIAALESAKTVFITAHVGPDGDTLGSMLGLKFALEKARPGIHRVDCVISGKMPDVYSFLPGIRDVLRMESATTLLHQYDIAISVDCGSKDRLGLGQKPFDAAGTSANIDHHISNDRFARINVVNPHAAASGEVVFDLLKAMAIPLDASIATCLYTAIMTDTGNFKYSSTSARIMEVASHLINAGAGPEYIYKQIYEKMPWCQVALQAEVVSAAQFNTARNIAWTSITREQLQKHGAEDEHVDGLVESLRQIDGVLISAIFKENVSGHTKVSLRSDSHDIDVAAIMGLFQGGGHRMAAGCTIEKPLAEARASLLPILEERVQAVSAAAVGALT
jgi:bifunctional oligoribonuclease and PAP phosphatase NrnA